MPEWGKHKMLKELPGGPFNPDVGHKNSFLEEMTSKLRQKDRQRWGASRSLAFQTECKWMIHNEITVHYEIQTIFFNRERKER